MCHFARVVLERLLFFSLESNEDPVVTPWSDELTIIGFEATAQELPDSPKQLVT